MGNYGRFPKGNEKAGNGIGGGSGNKNLVTEAQLSLQGPLIVTVMNRFRQRLLTNLRTQKANELSDEKFNKLLDYLTAQAAKFYKNSGESLNGMLEKLQKNDDTNYRQFVLTDEYADFLLSEIESEEVSFGQVRFRGGKVIELGTPSFPTVSLTFSFREEYVHAEIQAAVEEIKRQEIAPNLILPEVNPERFFALPKEWVFFAYNFPKQFCEIVEADMLETKTVIVHKGDATEKSQNFPLSQTHEGPSFKDKHEIITSFFELHKAVHTTSFDKREFTVPANRKQLLLTVK